MRRSSDHAADSTVLLQVYATQHGRALGAFDAHDDAVSCLVTCAAPDSIISASWDCSVKLWRYAGHLSGPLKAL